MLLVGLVDRVMAKNKTDTEKKNRTERRTAGSKTYLPNISLSDYWFLHTACPFIFARPLEQTAVLAWGKSIGTVCT